ncbi:MAG: response regulator [Deltaproteobacteria bacterium]|jgi:DNA-binding NtrC family response regulator
MKKILVIDDQQCIRELISEELISEGYRVHSLGDAKSVRVNLRFSKPDLVLLDLYLDEADGFGVLHDIKGQYPKIPVIIYTAYDSYREDPRVSTADGYVIKSMAVAELKEKIADVLEQQQTLEARGHGGPVYGKRRVALAS